MIADNRLALDAGWDEELLSLELAELSEAGYDLTMTGFSNEEIEELLVGAEQALQDESSDDTEDDAADDVPEAPSNLVFRVPAMSGRSARIASSAAMPRTRRRPNADGRRAGRLVLHLAALRQPAGLYEHHH